MDINELLKAGSDIMGDITYAVEHNRFDDLGSRVSGRIYDVTQSVNANKSVNSEGKTVYTGTVENTDKRDGTYRTNYNDSRGTGNKTLNAAAVGGIAGAAVAGGAGAIAGAAIAGALANAAENSKKQGGTTGQHRQQKVTSAMNKGYPTHGSGQLYQQKVGSYAKPASYRRTPKTPFFTREISTDTGLLSKVFGAIGTVIMSLTTLLFGAVSISNVLEADIATALVGFVVTLAFGVGAGLFGMLLKNGIESNRLAGQFNRYGNAVGKAEYFSIAELAANLGLKEKDVRRDLQKMMDKGYLPFAKFDATQSTLILTDKAYAQYVQAEQGRVARQQAQAAAAPAKAQSGKGYVDPAVQGILTTGKDYMKRVRYYNDLIPDDREMSNKLYRLENIVNRIFDQVEKDPDAAADLRKFMEYYLPTTDKLLQAYVELDKQPEVGDNIVKTREEIESVLDTINDAFEKLLDSLFQDMAWDVTSDISVMKTMMAQDGLVDKELEAYKVDPSQFPTMEEPAKESAPADVLEEEYKPTLVL